MEYTLEIINMENLCRVCLSDHKCLLSLHDHFKTEEKLTIKEVLESLMVSKIIPAENCPSRICETCLNALTTSYKLKEQFLNSTKVLENLFGKFKDQAEQTAPVEIIVGKEKYNLKDLLIVEDTPEENSDFDGFLKNLGKSLSVSFTNRVKEQPSVLLEPVHSKINHKVEVGNSNILIEPVESNINYLKGEITSEEEIEADEKVDSVGDVESEEINILNEMEINDEFTGRVSDVNVDAFINVLGKPLCENNVIKLHDNFDIKDMNVDILKAALSKRFECANCHNVYSSALRYKRHILTCVKLAEKYNNRFPCKSCKKLFKTAKGLRVHVKNVHYMESISCKSCNITLKNRRHYQLHKNKVHPDRASICDYCGKTFANNTSLKNHRLRHVLGDDAVHCICPVCGKTFNYKGGLYYHMKIHTGERKYACNYCDRRFYTKMSISRHEKTHTGIRPYECNICKKRFFSTGELKKHKFTHTGKSSHQCQYCNKYFYSKSNLRAHLTFYKGEYVCELCCRGFVSQAILQFHQRQKHKMKTEDVTEENLKFKFQTERLQDNLSDVEEITFDEDSVIYL